MWFNLVSAVEAALKVGIVYFEKPSESLSLVAIDSTVARSTHYYSQTDLLSLASLTLDVKDVLVSA